MTLGWYVHHHGSGHVNRFLAVRDRLPGVVAFSSLPRPAGVGDQEWVQLPLDAPAEPSDDPTAGGALHWAPLGHPGLRGRMAEIAAWIAEARPDAFVCDVSVEVALLVRLLGTPVIWLAQRGRRDDAPHRLVYAVATVVAPWTRAVEAGGSTLPAETVHIGALSRFDGRTAGPPPGRRRATLVLGRGGHTIALSQVRAAIAATPDWTWSVIGLDGAGVADPWRHLVDSDVVVGSAGGNIIAEVAAARRPFVCLPQLRPFDEQLEAAVALAGAGLADLCGQWPDAGAWPRLLERALHRDPADWSILHDGSGADRLADAVRSVAERGLRAVA